MIKKKLCFVVFVTLLLTLSLGLFGTCYAWSYDLTLDDIRTINASLNVSGVNENFYREAQNLLNMGYDVYYYVVYDSGKTCRLVGWYNSSVQSNSSNVYVSLKASDGNYGYVSQYNKGSVNTEMVASGTYAFRFNSGWSNQRYWFITGDFENKERQYTS